MVRVGEQCVFIRYRRTIRPGSRVFEPGDVIVMTHKSEGGLTVFHGVDGFGACIPWLRDTLYHDEYVRLRNAPMISAIPRPDRKGVGFSQASDNLEAQ